MAEIERGILWLENPRDYAGSRADTDRTTDKAVPILGSIRIICRDSDSPFLAASLPEFESNRCSQFGDGALGIPVRRETINLAHACQLYRFLEMVNMIIASNITEKEISTNKS